MKITDATKRITTEIIVEIKIFVSNKGKNKPNTVRHKKGCTKTANNWLIRPADDVEFSTKKRNAKTSENPSANALKRSVIELFEEVKIAPMIDIITHIRQENTDKAV